MKKLLLHVVDNEQRDFDVKLNVALNLASHGYQSILIKGSSLSGYIRSSRNCIVLGRLSANIPSQKELDNIFKSFSSVFYYHDEGGFYNDLTYNQSVSRLHALAFISHPAIKKVFFWGEHQLKIAQSLISVWQSKLSLAGSPRFDLFSHKSVLKMSSPSSITSILIATRGGSIFPSPKHAYPLGKRIRSILSLDFEDKDFLERTLFGKWKKTCIDAICVVDLIAELAIKFPHISITVRPHPSEDPRPYITAFMDYKNVSVRSDGDITSLLQNHSLLIGCDCTTGVEAILSGRLYINYRPIESRLLDKYTPRFLDRVGIVGDTKVEVCNIISSLLEGNVDYIQQHQKLVSDLSFLQTAIVNLPLESSFKLSFHESIVKELDDHCAKNRRRSSFSKPLMFLFYAKIFTLDIFRLRPFWINSVFWRLSPSHLRKIKQLVGSFNHQSPVCSVQINRTSLTVTPISH